MFDGIKRSYFTIKEIRALEANAFSYGIPIIELMENAGKAVAEEISDSLLNKTAPIFFFCGYGNNGGDGLVASRYLTEKGYICHMVLVGNKNQFNHLASQKNYDRLKELLPLSHWTIIRSVEDFTSFKDQIPDKAFIVDALLGIGIEGKLREPIKSIVTFLNHSSDQKILAVDVPSGYNSETKNPVYVKTPLKIVCLGKNKINSADFPNSKIVIKKIGIPKDAEEVIGLGDVKWLLPKRDPESHKKQNGVITIIGGSEKYIGAPALSALGAFRTGADLVFLVVPKDIRLIVNSFMPDFITIPGTENELCKKDGIDVFNDERLQDSTLVVGPGMENTEKTRELLEYLLSRKIRRNIVIDAGALSSLTETQLELLKNHNTVLTPHKGELFNVFATKLDISLSEQKRKLGELAKKWQTTILLKGHIDIIANKHFVRINRTGHPGMTVGGTGDILTGIVASILAITNSPFTSACLGAYISGKAGEEIAQKYGDGLMSSDISKCIHSVIKHAREFSPKEL